MMKRFVLMTAFFCFPVLILVVIISRFDNILQNEKNDNIIRIKEAINYDGLDFLFVGSSITYSAVIPAFFDSLHLKTYNLGIATAGPAFMEIVLDDYLGKVKNHPRIVVIEVSLLTFCNGSDDWVRYPVHRYLHEPLSNEYTSWHYGNSAIYFKMMRKSFIKGIRHIADMIVNQGGHHEPFHPDVQNEIIKHKGFFPSHEILNDSVYQWQSHLMKDYPEKEFLRANRNRMLGIINKLIRANCKVIVIEVPNSEFEKFFNENYLAEYRDCMDSLSLRKDITLIRPDPEMKFSYSEMRNITHLNTMGAIKYTRYLVKQMESLLHGKQN